LIAALLVGSAAALESWWPFRETDHVSACCKRVLVTVFAAGVVTGVLAFALMTFGNLRGVVSVGGTADNPIARAVYTLASVEVLLRTGIVPYKEGDRSTSIPGLRHSANSVALSAAQVWLYKRLLDYLVAHQHDKLRSLLLCGLPAAFTLDETEIQFGQWLRERAPAHLTTTDLTRLAELPGVLRGQRTTPNSQRVRVLWEELAHADIEWAAYLAGRRASTVALRRAFR
jgi:hypothetical protein